MATAAFVPKKAPPIGRSLRESARMTAQELARWHADGYLVVRRLWGRDEIAACAQRFADIAAAGTPIPGFWNPDPDSGDPLLRFPRVMHPHRFDPLARRMLLDARIETVLAALMGEEPIAAQSMFYYKPPGARGQALHQDNYYLRVRPHTCIAAWTAVDRSHPDNGGLYVCPGTHAMEVACPEEADPKQSFTTHLVRPPAGVTPVPVLLDPGDVLFFGGSIVHGSRPNAAAGEWRRSFICHYAPASFREMSAHYRPALRFDGREHRFADAAGGGPCGDESAGGDESIGTTIRGDRGSGRRATPARTAPTP